jgi:hypothetical protein
VVVIGGTQTVVEVEPFVLPIGADTEVGKKPTTSGGMAADTAGRWGEEGGTPFGTSVGHYWMKLPQPSSSCFPCARRSYHL